MLDGLAHGAWHLHRVAALRLWRGLWRPWNLLLILVRYFIFESVQVIHHVTQTFYFFLIFCSGVGTAFDALRLLVGGALVAQLDAVEVLRLLVVVLHAAKYYELIVVDCA